MIYGYIRVSSDRQTTENQEFEIRCFAQRKKLTVDKWIKETISSMQDLEKRKLGGLLQDLRDGDILIASELSRLGRNLLQVMSILHHCMQAGAQVWTIKDNYRLGTDIQSKVLAFAFGLSAEIERNLISQRTKEALQRLKAEGKVLGRPKGSPNKTSKLAGNEERIRLLLKRKFTKTRIARILGVNPQTLNRFLKKHTLPDL
ncbi:MAG: master DNA invertase Mpi family serine-type recombinase [Alphaproteobacteria bacterium]|jgi:DNA invertase Pin-like site-specific DNA recombinase